MIKKNKIPTIIGMLVLLVGVFAGVSLLKNNQIFKIGASATETPKDVRITSLSDSSSTISWVTEDSTVGFISYGTDTNVSSVANESESDQKYYTHSITITGLSPETLYYFKINSNGTTCDNNGVPWQFTTGNTLSIGQSTIPVSGSVITASGQPSNRAIVYVTVNGYIISTLTSENGTFVLQLGSVRTPDLSSYAKIDSSKTLLEVSVTTETGETATAKVFPQSANPIPTLIVGQDQDFRNLQPTSDGQNPNADLSLPETATIESKFDISDTETTPTVKSVTLESVTEGEMVTSDMPEFFGEGPTGKEITITVHSETELTGTAKVSSNGSWSWSPPTNLSEGSHTVTVSWIDALGIKRTLTRNFIVQAGELPSFEATPSATITPKPTTSATPKATSTASPKPTATKTASASSTPASLPVSGTLTPTLLLSMMGLAVIAFSFYTWKASRS